MTITAVRTVTCDIPLPRPVAMGDVRCESRDHVMVVIETDAGVAGMGFGMTRNSPIGATVDRNLAPLRLGSDPLMDRGAVGAALLPEPEAPGRGVLTRRSIG